jgi:hypothetical protein
MAAGKPVRAAAGQREDQASGVLRVGATAGGELVADPAVDAALRRGITRGLPLCDARTSRAEAEPARELPAELLPLQHPELLPLQHPWRDRPGRGCCGRHRQWPRRVIPTLVPPPLVGPAQPGPLADLRLGIRGRFEGIRYGERRAVQREVRSLLIAISCPDCSVPAEITERFSLPSTDGPVDHIALCCAAGHHFRMPTDRLSAQAQEQLAAQETRPRLHTVQLCIHCTGNPAGS